MESINCQGAEFARGRNLPGWLTISSHFRAQCVVVYVCFYELIWLYEALGQKSENVTAPGKLFFNIAKF